MKHSSSLMTVFLMVFVMTFVSACATGGKTVFSDEGDHRINVLTSTQDSKPLSTLVRAALRKNGQTAASLIRVSQDSDDTVKLTGNVQDDATIHEAERVAYQVSGVRFVVNNLAVRN